MTESRRYGNHLGVEFGAAYTSSAVIPDGTSPPEVDDTYSDYGPSATPGCRAPHIWLGRSSERLSTLDLIGSNLTLLAGQAGKPWRSAAARVADALGVTIDCYIVGTAGLQDHGAFGRAFGLEDDGAVLVRPDGHVAWRQTGGPPDGQSLAAVVVVILGR